MDKLIHASARIIGFTENTSLTETDDLQHHAVVAYEIAENEDIWAITQPCNEAMYGVNTVVEIMYRPDRARSVIILPKPSWKPGLIAFEKNFEIGMALLVIGCLVGMSVWYLGFALHILAAFLGMIGVGFASGYLTKGPNKRFETLEESHYQSMSRRLGAAQDNGRVPASLTD